MKELGDWRKTPAGEAAMKKSWEDAAKKRKQPQSGVAGNNSNDDNDNTTKRRKKFDKAIETQAKKILASAMEAEEADNDAFTARIDTAIKKHGTIFEISATAVI